VRIHAEVAAAMRHELVDLQEGAGIEEQVDALARRQFSCGVLLCKTIITAAQLGAPLEILEILQCVDIDKGG
jgi:hypothetical protein